MKKTNLKKFLLLFCMLAAFCMTACDLSNGTISSADAKREAKSNLLKTYESELITWANDMITYLDKTDSDQLKSDAEKAKTLDMINNRAYIINPKGINVKTIEFYNSWNSTRGELGSLKEIRDIRIEVSDKTGELCVITIDTAYSDNDKCSFEFVITEDLELDSGAINPSYTTGQKLYKAVMNTIIGMGTVFIVLIFISFIIYLFKFVNRFENKAKEGKQASAVSQSADHAVAQIEASEEQAEDDLELIAVITAAIAASEGTSADGLVVRSIRKVNNRRK